MPTETAIYKQLPPDAGTPFDQEVHLSGYRSVKIESRVIAERHLADFLRYAEHDAGQPAARMLLGAWGEGKTEAFHRFIKGQAERRQHRAFLVTSKSVANAYVHYDKLDTNEARLFVAAALHSLRDDGVDDIPYYDGTSPLPDWVEDSLQALGCETRKLFLFVDEVEQLLHEPALLRRVMLGIKHLLDGAITSLMPGGRFAGSLFIFFACTPEAYTRIATDPDIRQVFGGYGRRMDKIHIDSITLQESVRFVHDLLKYAYGGKLPEPLPVQSPGILAALATVAKRNMGQMVSLFARLMSSLRTADGHLTIVTPEQLRIFATGRQINIEGHDAKCFEDGLYTQIVQRMQQLQAGGDSYQRLFTTFLFDQRALSTSEIKSVLGDGTWQGLENWWLNYMNDTLSHLGYSPGLLAFHPLGAGVSADALFDNLRTSFPDREDKAAFRIAETTLSKQGIQNLLADWSFDAKGELLESILLPANSETARHILGPLNASDCERLLSIFRDFSETSSTHYRAPKDLLAQIFPPPCPAGLEFVRDPSERFKLWRRATLEYAGQVEKDLPHALASFATRSLDSPWHLTTDLQDLGSHLFAGTMSFERQPPKGPVSIPTWILSRAKVQAQDIAYCESTLSTSTTPAQLILVLTSEPLDPALTHALSHRMRRRVCSVTIHPTYAKQMLASFWHIKSGGAIYENALLQAKDTLLRRDLGFYDALNRWFEQGRSEGFVIDTPALSEGTHRGLVNALRLLLNAQGSARTLTEIFNWNRSELRSLVPYGSKSGLIPETDRLESIEGFRSLVADLQTNGFVTVGTDNRPTMQLSPPERLIIEQLSSGEVPRADWQKHFVTIAEPDTLIEELYVETLLQRGLIEKKRGRGVLSNTRSLVQANHLAKQAAQKAEDFKRRVNVFTSAFASFPAIAHIVVAKERDVQLITLAAVQATVEGCLNLIRSPKSDLDTSAQATFLLRFLEDSAEPVLQSARMAKDILASVPQKVLSRLNEYVTQALPKAAADLAGSISVTVAAANLQELAELKAAADQVVAVTSSAAQTTDQQLRTSIQQLPPEELASYFWFDTVGSEKLPHNYYSHRVATAAATFDEKARVIDRLLSALAEKLTSPKERRASLYRRLISHPLDTLGPCSRKTFDMLKSQAQGHQAAQQQASPTFAIPSLAELSSALDHRTPELNTTLTAIERACDAWERLRTDESELSAALAAADTRLAGAKTKFNLPEQTAPAAALGEFLAEAARDYANAPSAITEATASAIEECRKGLGSLKRHVGEVDSLIESDLWRPYFTLRTNRLAQAAKRITACQGLRQLPLALSERFETLTTSYAQQANLAAFLAAAVTSAEQLATLTSVADQAGEILKSHLSDAERQLLSTLIDLSTKGTAEASIDMATVAQSLPATSPQELFETLSHLWSKGVLTVRVSL